MDQSNRSIIDAIFSNRQYFADIDNSFFGVATDIGEYKMGVTVRSFNMGDINETTVFYPDGTGQVFTPNFSILGGTIAKKLSDNTSVGMNVNYIREGFGMNNQLEQLDIPLDPLPPSFIQQVMERVARTKQFTPPPYRLQFLVYR